MNDAKTLLSSEDRAADLRTFDRLIENLLSSSPLFGWRRVQQPGYSWAPAVDIRETDADFIAYVALPGLEKEDVSLEVKENMLVVSGRMKPLGSDEDTWLRRELPRGDFYRAFELPANVQADKVKASMRGGVLEIRLGKAEEARPRKVVID